MGRSLSRSIFFWKWMMGSSMALSWISVGGITMLQSMKSAMASSIPCWPGPTSTKTKRTGTGDSRDEFITTESLNLTKAVTGFCRVSRTPIREKKHPLLTISAPEPQVETHNSV
ncbi:hypothetical protein EYF80_064505 [Liparis tanakae]|uniref:Uncharacterized protein n=1 Tax=Liparis tanakae TaxID=230148 RepID=A0A4Z2E964_9TELE|nr:hypothetical protein EYF80_064505 [Liparis tanakae]